MNSAFIKTNRVFSPIRKYAWLFIPLVAVGGLWYPKLGLLMLPIMLTLAVMGFFKAKYWCGNLCPHGSLFDYVLMPLSANRKIPAVLKSKITMAVLFAWFMAMLSMRLYSVFLTWGSTSFWDKLGYVFVLNYLIVTIVGTVLAIFISPRAWCSVCPMGTFETLSYRLGTKLELNTATDKKVTISQLDKCRKCGKCAKVCPMQLSPYLEFSANKQFESEACIRCSTCVKNCPLGILSMQAAPKLKTNPAKADIE